VSERKYGPYTLVEIEGFAVNANTPHEHISGELARHIRELEVALSAYRETNTRLNRRSQEANAAAADAKRCLDELAAGTEKGTPWCGGNFGRALLAWHSSQQDERIKELEAANATLTAERDARVVLPEYTPGPRSPHPVAKQEQSK
jgi:hypothetical protein